MATILIVEDSPDNMKLVATVLRLKEHVVHEMVDGEGLIDRLTETRPDLVLMDIQLPGKDGYTLLEEIRASAHAGLRVVALTAHAMSGDRDRALEAGFDGYITKPIDVRRFPEQLVRAMKGEIVAD